MAVPNSGVILYQTALSDFSTVEDKAGLEALDKKSHHFKPGVFML